MAITYNNPEIANNATSVEVTFTNDEGKVFKRHINVPYKDGAVDADGWAVRLEEHLAAVKHKVSVGVVSFVDPTDPANANTAPGAAAAAAPAPIGV
jgi:hypothetical protein